MRNPNGQNDLNSPTEQAIITASPAQMAEIARAHSITLERVITSENGIVGFYESGPEVLNQVADHLHIPRPGWDLLSEHDQAVLIGLTAGSLDWAIDGVLDPYQIEQTLKTEIGMRERICTAGEPPAEAADQTRHAILSAPPALLEEIAARYQLTLKYIEESENRAHGHYDDGPGALAQLQDALGADPARAPGWDDLTPNERREIVTRVLIDNPTWISEREIGEAAASEFLPDEPITGRITGQPRP